MSSLCSVTLSSAIFLALATVTIPSGSIIAVIFAMFSVTTLILNSSEITTELDAEGRKSGEVSVIIAYIISPTSGSFANTPHSRI